MIRTRPTTDVDEPFTYSEDVVVPVEELDNTAWLLGLHHSSRFPLLVRPLRGEGPFPHNLFHVETGFSARMHSLLSARFSPLLAVHSFLTLYRSGLP